MENLIILMGPTGAGKSVQGDLLAQDYQGVHLSSGKLLRRDPHAAALTVGGGLAPAAEVERVIGEAIDEIPEGQLIILDGFPRTESNVRWIDNELLSHHRQLKKVVLIDLDLPTILKRLELRDRADDAPAAVRAKWDIFQNQTMKVVEHYRELGKLAVVDGRGSVEEVHELIKEAVK
ncbi:MAG: adenylate kinase family protein [Patescibacteria group bacterium]|nr:adenylate kinase family protein [Patescibacteria group bacterium]